MEIIALYLLILIMGICIFVLYLKQRKIIRRSRKNTHENTPSLEQKVKENEELLIKMQEKFSRLNSSLDYFRNKGDGDEIPNVEFRKKNSEVISQGHEWDAQDLDQAVQPVRPLASKRRYFNHANNGVIALEDLEEEANDETLYILEELSVNKAAIETYYLNEKRWTEVLQTAHLYVDDICRYEGSASEYKSVYLVTPGTAERRDGEWTVINKVEIELRN